MPHMALGRDGHLALRKHTNMVLVTVKFYPIEFHESNWKTFLLFYFSMLNLICASKQTRVSFNFQQTKLRLCYKCSEPCL